MRYAIISDIHSNLESIKQFLEIIPKYEVEKIICLGNLVGYNTNPNECVKIISMLKNIEIIRGNHDRVLITKDYYDFSDNARDAIIWNIKHSNDETKEFIKNLVMGPKIIDETFAICHGSLIDEDNYLFTPGQTKYDFQVLKETEVKVAFFGHTHWQTIFRMDNNDKIESIKKQKMTLEKEEFYLINPGSIGQPRDRDPRASFLIFDSEKNEIQNIRYNYSFQVTQRKILENKLPEFLAERLAFGV